jgi:hypothetical protein
VEWRQAPAKGHSTNIFLFTYKSLLPGRRAALLASGRDTKVKLKIYLCKKYFLKI